MNTKGSIKAIVAAVATSALMQAYGKSTVVKKISVSPLMTKELKVMPDRKRIVF